MWRTVLLRSIKINLDVLVTIAVIVALVGSALAVALSVHHWRETLQELQVLKQEAKALDVEWGQLLLEQNSWGGYARIEQLAQQQKMQAAPLQDVVMVQP
ncbi:MAG: cell division protein FtsL [Moraxellaceae bacterium]|nr:cell division protein FtsL [Pseudomonadales bacterium]MCP5174233.1 cell division protein FtsL [Moraxellaceae bacterium]MCP5176713.1 cell division protein FtsL [Moraxellaceae bacterium]HQV21858.1 cell division protein FtsL [Agitococcus sp.]